jgi:hypothetical protein
MFKLWRYLFGCLGETGFASKEVQVMRGDEPIKKASDDALGRSLLANEVTKLIRRLGATEGVVVGVLGPWGAGKTSLINMIEEALSSDDQIPVVRFNPWMFSGTDQLVDRFFSEIAHQLGQRPQAAVKGIARNLALYGKVLSPLKGVPIAGALVAALEGIPEAAKALHDLIEEQEGGAIDQREELTEELSKLDRPIVVVIDDIDRLTPAEIRDILKLVRLTGSFPNIVYVLAFDRVRVESILSEPGISGREYLKKIIQVPIDLPAMPNAALTEQLVAALDESLSEVQRQAIVADHRWTDVLWRVIRPLVRTIRDVRQYVASLSVTLGVVGDNVSLVDLLALEAVRVFLPDVYASVTEHQDAFTGLTDSLMPWEEMSVEPIRKEAIQKVIEDAGPSRRVVEGMIRVLFPAAERHLDGHLSETGPAAKWRREKRVADAAVLSYYLEHVAGHKLQGMQEAQRLLPLIGNRALIENTVQALNPSVWPDVIGSWWLAVDEIPTDSIPHVIAAVINLVAAAPDRHQKPFDYDTRSTGLGLVWRLLNRLPTGDEKDTAVRSAMNEIDTYLGKVELLQLVSEKDRDGAALISTATIDDLSSSLVSEIGDSTLDRLSTERELFQVLSWAKKISAGKAPVFELPLAEGFSAALLKSAATRVHTRDGKSIAVNTAVGLHWEELVSLLDGEENVRQMIEALEGINDDPELQRAVGLAHQYLDKTSL